MRVLAVAAGLAVVAAEGGASTLVDWNYVHHGQDWDMGQCMETRQSPIDFNNADPWNNVPTSKVFLDMESLGTDDVSELSNNGHALVVNLAGRGLGGVTYEGQWYNLLDVNFHAASEHTMYGEHFPMEIHVVFKHASVPKVLVFAFWVLADDSASPDHPLKAITQAFIPQVGKVTPIQGAVDLNGLFTNPTGSFFTYEGSLTVPPCSQMALWFVRREPLKFPSAEVTGIKFALMKSTGDFGNYRSVMPRNGRTAWVTEAAIGKPIYKPSPLPPGVAPLFDPSVVRASDFKAYADARAAARNVQEAEKVSQRAYYRAFRSTKASRDTMPDDMKLRAIAPHKEEPDAIPTLAPGSPGAGKTHEEVLETITDKIADQARAAAKIAYQAMVPDLG